MNKELDINLYIQIPGSDCPCLPFLTFKNQYTTR